MARPEPEFELAKATSTPPRLLAWIVALLLPPSDQRSRKSLLKNLWRKYPSVWQVLPPLAVEVPHAIVIQIRNAFYSTMVIAQACTLFIAFAGVMSWSMLQILGLTFVALIIREAYIPRNERLEHEFVTAFMAPILVVVFYVGFGAWHWARGLPAPYFAIQSELLVPRLFALAVPIAWVRKRYAPESGRQNPHKLALRLYYRTWLFNDLWITCALTFLLSLEAAAPSKWFFQGFVTVNPAVLLFTTAIRFQLNPLGGISRHRRILISLFTDPFEDEIREMRDYLLAGADWFVNFSAQSVCEILAFFFSITYLLVGLWQWHVGDPNALSINWTQMAVDAVAWIGLMITWAQIKQINRNTRKVFDQTLRARLRVAKNFPRSVTKRPSQSSCLIGEQI
jgi:hypothetical protein